MIAQNILPEPLIFELNFATGGYSHDVNKHKIFVLRPISRIDLRMMTTSRLKSYCHKDFKISLYLERRY